MSKRQVFFSFHYDNDNWRAGQVRNMGKVDDNSTFSDNDWEQVKMRSDDQIKNWIDSQLSMRSCLVLLIGEHTAGRKWIKYEIKKAYELDKGMVGIYIHKLKNKECYQGKKGDNPFDAYTYNDKPLSNFIKCHESLYIDSKDVYNDINNNIENLIEYGINHKPSTW